MLMGRAAQSRMHMHNRPVSLIRLAGLPLSLTLLSILAGSVIDRVMVLAMDVAATTRLTVWGLGFQLGRALASVLGAGLVDLMSLVTGGAPLLAYGTGFAVEATLLIGALLAYGPLRPRAARALSDGRH